MLNNYSIFASCEKNSVDIIVSLPVVTEYAGKD